MCTNPISLRNPDFRGQGLAVRKYKDGISYLKPVKVWSPDSVTDSAFSRKLVPCGTCEQCLAKRQLQWVQRCIEASRDSHVLFCTNTYKDSMIKTMQCGDRILTYVNWSDFDESLIRSARDNDVFGRPFKYLACSEYGEKRHRAHIHYLLFIPIHDDDPTTYPFELADKWTKHMFKYWSRNMSTSRKNPVREPCSLFIRRIIRNKIYSTYDVQPVIPSRSKRRLFPSQDIFKEDELNVSFYVTKYVLKYDPYVRKTQQWMRQNLSDEEYNEKWNLFKPQVHTSKYFGLSQDSEAYIKSSLDEVLAAGVHHQPRYVYPDGSTAPLSRFYRDGSAKINHCFLDADVAKRFITSDPNNIDGSSSHYSQPLTPEQLDNIKQKFDRISLQIRDKSLDLDVL